MESDSEDDNNNIINNSNNSNNSNNNNNDNNISNLHVIWTLGEKLRDGAHAKTKRERQQAAIKLTEILSNVSIRQSLARELENKAHFQGKYEKLWQRLIRNAILAARFVLPSNASMSMSASRGRTKSKAKKMDDALALLPYTLLKHCDSMYKQYFLA